MSHPMTPEGFESLKRELHTLKTDRRQEISRALNAAVANGDLKENGDYHAAKAEQGLIEGRIAQLEYVLSVAEVIDISKIKQDGRVVFGSTVTLLNSDTQERLKMKIVGELESDFSKGRVSVTAPLVKACIGRSVGDAIEFIRGAESVWYDIEAVEYL